MRVSKGIVALLLWAGLLVAACSDGDDGGNTGKVSLSVRRAG